MIIITKRKGAPGEDRLAALLDVAHVHEDRQEPHHNHNTNKLYCHESYGWLLCMSVMIIIIIISSSSSSSSSSITSIIIGSSSSRTSNSRSRLCTPLAVICSVPWSFDGAVELMPEVLLLLCHCCLCSCFSVGCVSLVDLL